ncbi:acyltransferase [Streptomyces tendae]|uniref:acyltransferase family protein n=1 Tax=Streptomyces tendae TaxID=1932 RepID=UPI0036B14CE2
MYTSPLRNHRLEWVDNLRVALTVLVVLHHAAQPYGPADWWYVEGQPRSGALATLSAVDGSFFMSLFFFVSAVFIPGSYERRGARRFLGSRLVRLGIPVVVGALTIVPGLMYAYFVHYRGYPPMSFPRYFTDVYLGLGDEPAGWSGPSWPDLQFGHLWFVQNLLAYTVVYVALRRLSRPLRFPHGKPGRALPLPGHRALVVLTVLLAAATFFVRLRYPLDEWVPFLDFLQVEPARVPQYVTFFALGVVAARQNWLERFDAGVGRVWLGVGATGVALLFLVGPDSNRFGPGGADVPSASWAAYESLLCVALCVGLLTLFRELVQGSTPWSREMAANSYAVYIIHLPVVVAMQYGLADRGLSAAGSCFVVFVLAVPSAFLLAAGLRRLPAVRRVL